MSFIRGVLARARGEASRVRPRLGLARAALHDAPENDAAFAPTRDEACLPLDTLDTDPAHPRLEAAARHEAPVRTLAEDGEQPGPVRHPPIHDAAMREPPPPNGARERSPAARHETSPDAAPEHPSSPVQAPVIHARPQSVAQEARLHARASIAHAEARAPVAPGPRRAEVRADEAARTRAESVQVEIHIGRLEVAPAAPARASNGAARAAPSPLHLTLNDYLAKRSTKR